MFSEDEIELINEEHRYWDDVEEQDDGIPRRYAAQKAQVVYLREGEDE